jgi:parallel beta-helix repeat protein
VVRRLRLLASAVLLLAACDPPDTTAPTSLRRATEGVARGAVIVTPGSSIQAAIDAAAPGSTVLIQPGVYSEAITISKPGIRLRGLGAGDGRARAVVIRNPGGADDGITVTPAGHGVEIAHLTVQGFGENGVLLTGVDGFRLVGIIARNDGEYGLFPVHSSHGVIEHCTASGHEDTGIYVGQSEHVSVRQSTAFRNVNGIEIENSSHIAVLQNESYGNVAGILVVLLPGLDVKTSSDILVRHPRAEEPRA